MAGRAAKEAAGKLSNRMLESGRQGPRRQRHTAHRIRVRPQSEHPEPPIGEQTVRRYVATKARTGSERPRSLCATELRLGQEAQVDWFEATAKLGGERIKLHFFAMRSVGPGDAFRLCATTT
jgi:hypothetical protein